MDNLFRAAGLSALCFANCGDSGLFKYCVDEPGGTVEEGIGIKRLRTLMLRHYCDPAGLPKGFL